MKKFAILLLMSCFALTAAAQDETAEAENVKNVRKKFFNISYLSDKIKFSEGNIGLNNAFDEVEGRVLPMTRTSASRTTGVSR